MAKAPASKAPAPKKEKNPPPPEDDDDLKKGDEKKEAPPAPKGGGQLKLIILVAAAMVVGIGVAVVAMKVLGGSKPAPAVQAAEAPAEEEHGAPPPVAPQRSSGGQAPAAESGAKGGGHGEESAPVEDEGPINVEFKPSFISNLNDLGGRRMIKLTMSVEADTQELADEITAKMPQLRDTILLLLSSVQSDDVSGMDGKQRLKNQMLNRINPSLTKGKIRNLYFSEIVVQ